MKIKIISGIRSDLLEASVNEFIADKIVLDMKYQSFIQEKFIYDRVLVMYMEKQCDGDSCPIVYDD